MNRFILHPSESCILPNLYFSPFSCCILRSACSNYCYRGTPTVGAGKRTALPHETKVCCNTGQAFSLSILGTIGVACGLLPTRRRRREARNHQLPLGARFVSGCRRHSQGDFRCPC